MKPDAITIDALIQQVVVGAIQNLRDPGPPLNAMLITDVGHGIFLDEVSCRDPVAAAVAQLSIIAQNRAASCCVLYFDSAVTLADGTRMDGIQFLCGDLSSEKHNIYFLPYVTDGDHGVTKDPPELHILGTSKSLLMASNTSSFQPEIMWRDS